VTVYERTGEIGTLRSLGLQRRDIIFQFLLEGFYLAFFGGIFGSILGGICVFAINAIKFTTPLPGASSDVLIQADYVFSAFMISILLGMIATLLGTIIPAWRASKLAIVEALRRNI
jgi:putative ABC transport system permease protein